MQSDGFGVHYLVSEQVEAKNLHKKQDCTQGNEPDADLLEQNRNIRVCGSQL